MATLLPCCIKSLKKVEKCKGAESLTRTLQVFGAYPWLSLPLEELVDRLRNLAPRDYDVTGVRKPDKERRKVRRHISDHDKAKSKDHSALPGADAALLDEFWRTLGSQLEDIYVRREKWIDEFVARVGAGSQEADLRTLLGFIGKDNDVRDLRWVAYMLATTKGETGGFKPIEEGLGSRSGKPYNDERTVVDPATKAVYKNRYYGRGYVQLTHDDRYRYWSERLGMDQELYYHPEKALEPETSYKVMSIGMREGRFRSRRVNKKWVDRDSAAGGHKLADYIHGTTCDYLNARNIINGGLDRAAWFKRLAEEYEKHLRECLKADEAEDSVAFDFRDLHQSAA
jgi:hypothetical protein